VRERWQGIRGVRALIFDLGGTVLSMDHSRIAHCMEESGVLPGDNWIPVAERQGRRIADRLVHQGASAGEIWQGYFAAYMEGAGAPPEKVVEIYDRLAEFHRRHHLWNRPIPGVAEALASLARAGYRLACVSNSDGRAESTLVSVGLARDFEFVIDSDEVGIEKPDPRIFRLATNKLGLAPVDCAYVGDIISFDIEGSIAAGLRAILLDHYGSYEPADLPAGVPRAVEASEILAGLSAAPAAEREGEA
jgi:HAD superfamily hydrolase (TIGR01509 family)